MTETAFTTADVTYIEVPRIKVAEVVNKTADLVEIGVWGWGGVQSVQVLVQPHPQPVHTETGFWPSWTTQQS